MHYEEKLQMLWAMCFIVSGVIFAMAFWFTPVIGVLAALGYIVLYVGLSISFLIVFSGMKKLSKHLSVSMETRKAEIIEIQKELKSKYLKKKIGEQSYRNLNEKYESELTEIHVKLMELAKDSKRKKKKK